MRLVSELPSQSNERSSEQGQVADSSVRRWKVLLSSPQESYDIQATIGVRIGDPHPVNTSVPCIAISETADGESRLVRIVTATYRTTPGDGGGGQDPQSQQPDIRPAKITMTSSLIEVPTRRWWTAANPDVWIPAVNPAKDIYDGLTKLCPILNVQCQQYTSDFNDNSSLGNINSDAFTLGSMAIDVHTCMFRGYSLTPHVEFWGNVAFRGWLETFEFSIHRSAEDWLTTVPLSGFNIINNGLGAADVEQEALSLAHVNLQVDTGFLRLSTPAGKKVRANVAIHSPEGGWMQRPSASPVPLNENGTPRSKDANPPVILKSYGTQYRSAFGDNFSGIGVRIREVVNGPF